MDIGARVRLARKQAQLSQEALARQAGMSLSAVRQIEQGGRTDPHYSTVSKIAAGLNMQVSELLEEPTLAGKGEAPQEGAGPTTAEESAEERSLPTADEMDSVTDLLERLVAQRHKTIDEWRDDGVDAFEAAICGSIEMDAANDQLYRDLQDRGASEVLERWKNNPNLVAEVDSKAARREAAAFYELLQTAVRARNVTQELAKQSDSSRVIAGVEEERLKAIPNNVPEFKKRVHRGMSPRDARMSKITG